MFPNKANRPGLVYDSDFNDWLAFLCGTKPAGIDPATCASLADGGYSLDPSDLNSAVDRDRRRWPGARP